MRSPGTSSPLFADRAELRAADAASVARALARLASAAGRRAFDGPKREERARIGRLAAHVQAVSRPDVAGRGGVVAVARAEALDLAAELVELADLLHRAGHLVEAFALEGVEARLVEALLGAGALEGT